MHIIITNNSGITLHYMLLHTCYNHYQYYTIITYRMASQDGGRGHAAKGARHPAREHRRGALLARRQKYIYIYIYMV